MRFLQALALICGLASPALADGKYFLSPTPSTTTGTAYQAIAGQFYIAASSANISTTTAIIPTKSTWTISLDGTLGAGYFRGTGNNQFSLYLSSGITMSAGGIYTAFVSATKFFGDLIGNVTGNLTGNVVGNLTGNVTGNVTGNSTTATTATNLAGGGAGQLPYQSGAGATAMLAAGANTQVLVGGASAPAWSTTAGSTVAVNISGIAARATAFPTNPTTCSAQAATGIDANGNAVGCFSAGSGDVVKASTQTLSGFNTFTGSTTFSGVVLGAVVSSGTIIPALSVTATACGVCQATVTFTSPGTTAVFAAWVNAVLTSNGVSSVNACLLKDAAVITDPLGSVVSFFTYVSNASDARPQPMTATRDLLGQTFTAGTRSVCISIYTNTGTISSTGVNPTFGIHQVK